MGKDMEAVQTDPRVLNLVPSAVLNQLSPTELLIPYWQRHVFRLSASFSEITKDTAVNHCCEKSESVPRVTGAGAFLPPRLGRGFPL